MWVFGCLRASELRTVLSLSVGKVKSVPPIIVTFLEDGESLSRMKDRLASSDIEILKYCTF